jgi:hypothetical protein
MLELYESNNLARDMGYWYIISGLHLAARWEGSTLGPSVRRRLIGLVQNLRMVTFSCFRSPKEKKYGMLGPSGVTPCYQTVRLVPTVKK